MNEDKARFLFGEVPVGIDLDDVDARSALLAETAPPTDSAAWSGLREAIATQIAEDTPPEVWQRAQKLVAGGLDRVVVLEQLTAVLAYITRRIVLEQTPFDEAEYVAALRRLPLPEAD